MRSAGRQSACRWSRLREAPGCKMGASTCSTKGAVQRCLVIAASVCSRSKTAASCAASPPAADTQRLTSSSYRCRAGQVCVCLVVQLPLGTSRRGSALAAACHATAKMLTELTCCRAGGVLELPHQAGQHGQAQLRLLADERPQSLHGSCRDAGYAVLHQRGQRCADSKRLQLCEWRRGCVGG